MISAASLGWPQLSIPTLLNDCIVLLTNSSFGNLLIVLDLIVANVEDKYFWCFLRSFSPEFLNSNKLLAFRCALVMVHAYDPVQFERSPSVVL